MARYGTTEARPAWNLIGKFLTGGDVARAFTMANYVRAMHAALPSMPRP